MLASTASLPPCFGTILPFFLRFQPPFQRSWFSQSLG
jgi:hypothetical protein